MQGIFQKENTDKALKYGIYRHLPTYEKIIRNLVSFSDKKDIITKSRYPVTIFKNPRTAAPYAIFYQPAERTIFMEVQAEPDMIGNYIEMYHLAPAKHMDQEHWLAVPLDGSVSNSKVLDLLDISYDLVDGQVEADGEAGADRQTTDSTTEEKD